MEVELYKILIKVFIQQKLQDKLGAFEEVSDCTVFIQK